MAAEMVYQKAVWKGVAKDSRTAAWRVFPTDSPTAASMVSQKAV